MFYAYKKNSVKGRMGAVGIRMGGVRGRMGAIPRSSGPYGGRPVPMAPGDVFTGQGCSLMKNYQGHSFSSLMKNVLL